MMFEYWKFILRTNQFSIDKKERKKNSYDILPHHADQTPVHNIERES